MDKAGVDVGEPFRCSLALASACESAERYEAAEAMGDNDVVDFFLNIEGVEGFVSAMGDGSGEPSGMVETRGPSSLSKATPTELEGQWERNELEGALAGRWGERWFAYIFLREKNRTDS